MMQNRFLESGDRSFAVKFPQRTIKTILLCLLLVVPIFAQVKLVPHQINLKNGKNFNLNLPAD